MTCIQLPLLIKIAYNLGTVCPKLICNKLFCTQFHPPKLSIMVDSKSIKSRHREDCSFPGLRFLRMDQDCESSKQLGKFSSCSFFATSLPKLERQTFFWNDTLYNSTSKKNSTNVKLTTIVHFMGMHYIFLIKHEHISN